MEEKTTRQQGLLSGKPEQENSDLSFRDIRLVVFQDSVNDVAHFSGNSANACQMVFALGFLFLVIGT